MEFWNNIIRKTSLKVKVLKFIRLFVLLLLWSCNEHLHDENNFWSVKLNENNSEFTLEFTFNAPVDTVVPFDVGIFSHWCNNEDTGINGFEIKDLCAVLKKNQVIIENEDGQKRIFANYFFLENEEKGIWMDDCFLDAVDTLTLDKGKKLTKTVNIDYLSDLFVTDNDDMVRFYYIYHYENRGDCLILKSNWIEI